MTNKEKAQEMAEEYRVAARRNDCFDENELDCLYEDMYKYVLNMAEWKDGQFDSMINHFYHLIQNGISYEKAYKEVTGKDWQKV